MRFLSASGADSISGLSVRVTILGVPGSGKSWLAQALATSQPGLQIAVSGRLICANSADCVLLMGLDLPSAQASAAQDAQLRAALALACVPFRVIYGIGPARLQNAINSIAYCAYRTNPAGQFPDALNSQQQWHWPCDRCSDTGCERRLFTPLTAPPSTGSAAAHPAS